MDEKVTTEQLILQSAENEFMQKGFSGARTTSIAAAAGVTHAMLHYYFRTKEALFEKVIEQKFHVMSQIILDLLNREGVDIMAKLEQGLAAHFKFLVENPRLPLVIMSEVAFDKSALSLGMMSAMYGAVATHCRKQIEQAVADGRMRQATIEDLLVDIIGLNITSVALAEPFCKTMQIGKEEFLRSRLEENIKTLRYRITP